MTIGKRYYPVSLDIEGKLCVVAGAGKIAVRKVRQLLESGAKIKVIGEKTGNDFKGISSHKNVSLLKRPFRKSDLKGAFLAIAATDDKALNRKISTIAKEMRILVNVVDSSEDCDFILPSVMRRGNITVAVSSDGHTPILSRKVRETIESQIGAEYALYSKILSSLRVKIYKDKDVDKKKRQMILEKLCDGTLLEMIKNGCPSSELNDFVKRVCGKEMKVRK